jgi:short-subunit dehydrogenase
MSLRNLGKPFSQLINRRKQATNGLILTQRMEENGTKMKVSKSLLLGGALLFFALIIKRILPHASFAGQTIVITGGSRGLGLALAKRIAMERVNLAIIARDEGELERAKRLFIDTGSTITTWVCDVRNEAALQSTIEAIAARFGGIDMLINNAGEIVVGPFAAMNRDDFERALNIHFWAPLNAILFALPYLERARPGRVINIASFGGKLSVPHLLPYCASKFALVGLSDGLRAELAAKNVFVTTVAPGLMRTGSHKNALFKGSHRREFAWFSLGAANPLASMAAGRAARQILDAARKKRPELIVTFPARAAVVLQALFPNTLPRIINLVCRLLPKMPVTAGDETRDGWHSQSKISPSILTILADRATDEYNGRQ